jgi:hypothetical protein
MVNIIIYNSLQDEEIFLSSLKLNTIVIKYNDNIDNEYLLNLIDENIEYIGFVYHYSGYNNIPYFNSIDIDYDIIKNHNYIYLQSQFINLINEIYNKNKNIIIDLITCNVNNSNFISEISNLKLKIRYSTNEKGNLFDWIQESHNINIKNIYFNDNINNWNHILTNSISNNDILNINDGSGNVFKLIDNTFYLLRDITWAINNLNILTDTDFIQLNDNQRLNGNNFKIYLISDNEGIISTNNTTYNNRSIIENLNVIRTSGNLTNAGGGIIRRDQKYFEVRNCSYDGLINSSSAGGICGVNSGLNGQCLVHNCSSSGNISTNGGGIAGGQFGYNGIAELFNCFSTGNNLGQGGNIVGNLAGRGGVAKIYNCYSSGTIGSNGGGIGGRQCGGGAGNCRIYNCFSIGNITAYGGGICGGYTGQGTNSYCYMYNCFSFGLIGGKGGGITGSNSGRDGGNFECYNCYSMGNLNSDSGGISGEYNGFNGTSFLIYNCYSTGTLLNTNAGGMVGLYSRPSGSISYCVHKATNTMGSSGSSTLVGNSNDLNSISNQLYTNWSSDVWLIGNNSVNGDIPINMPILKSFINFPWINYNKYNDIPEIAIIKKNLISYGLKQQLFISTTLSLNLSGTIIGNLITSNENNNYLYLSGFKGTICKFNLFDASGQTDFSYNKLNISLELSNVSDISSSLKLFKIDDSNNFSNNTFYPIDVCYNYITSLWETQLPTLSNFVILDMFSPTNIFGGDPYVKNIKTDIIKMIPNFKKSIVLIKNNKYTVISYNDKLAHYKLLKMHTIHKNKEILLNENLIKPYVFNYMLKLEIINNITNDKLIIDLFNGNILENNNFICENIKTKNGLNNINNNYYYPKKLLKAYLIYLDNFIIEIKIDNYWVELNNIKIYNV